VPILTNGSTHSCLPIPWWQRPLWKRQIAKLYDRIRCIAAVHCAPQANFHFAKGGAWPPFFGAFPTAINTMAFSRNPVKRWFEKTFVFLHAADPAQLWPQLLIFRAK